MKKAIIFCLIGLMLAFGAKVWRMHTGGQLSLLPCVHLFGEWRKIPLWPCPPAENPAGDKWEWPDGNCC